MTIILDPQGYNSNLNSFPHLLKVIFSDVLSLHHQIFYYLTDVMYSFHNNPEMKFLNLFYFRRWHETVATSQLMGSRFDPEFRPLCVDCT